MAVFGLFGADCLLLLIHLRADGRLPRPAVCPPHRVHVAPTRGITRQIDDEALDMATEGVRLLFGVHVRGMLEGDGVWRLLWGWRLRAWGRVPFPRSPRSAFPELQRGPPRTEQCTPKRPTFGTLLSRIQETHVLLLLRKSSFLSTDQFQNQ